MLKDSPVPTRSSRPSKPTGFFAKLSLAQKVPLEAAILILVVGTAISAASYLEVKRTGRAAAHQHVLDLVQIVGTGRQTAGQGLLAGVRRLSAREPIVALATDPSEARRAAALAYLTDQTGQSQTIVATQVVGAQGQVLASTDSALNAPGGDFPAAIPEGDSGSVGKLRPVHDSLLYPVAVNIPGGSGAMLVQWRKVTTTAQANLQAQQALGAGMLLGNSDGSFWTDLNKVVAAPPPSLFASKDPVEYTRDAKQGNVIGAFMPMAGTPWTFGVEIPTRTIDQAAAAYLKRILAFTLLFVLIGAAVAGELARRLARPLVDLTDAAAAIAIGDHTGEVPVVRGDEIGRLTESFGLMARQIRDSQQRLEAEVDDRTSELHKALQQLRDAQEALIRRERLAMLGQLAGGVGHELRNPLGVMSNAVYYLEAVLQSSPDNVRDYLGLLREQITLSSRIVSDLLDSATIAPPQRRSVCLRTLVDSQVARLPKGGQVQIDVDVVATLPRAEVDPMHLGQAMFNLLTNAVQAVGDAPGQVRVSAHTVGDQMLAVKVSDSGPGIQPELIDRIFEPLFTTKARGIGLGLSVSRAMVQANGGELSVTSDPGHGATFTITMPAAVAVPA